MRVLYLLLTIIFLLYVLYAGYFYLNQRAILFPRHLISAPVGTPVVPGLEQIGLKSSEGQIEAWYLAPLDGETITPSPLLILAHGNGDLIDHWLSSVSPLRQMGVGVLLVEYPGY